MMVMEENEPLAQGTNHKSQVSHGADVGDGSPGKSHQRYVH